MSTASKLELMLSFQDAESPEKQEKLTQTLWQQMRQIDGVKVDRVSDDNPPEGSKTFGAFLLGLLRATVTLEGLKSLFGFLGDRLGNKPIKIKAKFADGREVELEASSREELALAEETLKRLAQTL
ncbi:hypothetical protein Q2T42_22090 [Leptolyngbya boryana CZ1]|uniref:Uncharacterized protein n=1 Tax=Leptolyngbya boryana CZ1 TaxID=3060204 RepID=A0AA96WUM1_LEPBY|nr:hypothetical protein [Leptolyngbya boryana]WNZ44494.1 hypothetical protein Q2T42_22090 [Leptolyngbya boryana CZ1]